MPDSFPYLNHRTLKEVQETKSHRRRVYVKHRLARKKAPELDDEIDENNWNLWQSAGDWSEEDELPDKDEIERGHGSHAKGL